MSRGHFRHLPVSGDADLVGMLDITDVCRALIGPDLSQRHGPWSVQRAEHGNMCTAGRTVAGKLMRPASATGRWGIACSTSRCHSL
jgi:hypothetical protein